MTSVLAPVYSARDTNVFTSRLSSTAILAIDSEDRFRNYDDAQTLGGLNRSPYSFSINKPASLMSGFFTRLGVTEVVFPYVIPNINVNTNRIIFFWYNAGVIQPPTILTLPIGFYTPAQIASELQTQIRAIDPLLASFVMTYGIQSVGLTAPTQRPIFEYASLVAGITVQFVPLPASGSQAIPDRTKKQLFNLLGFNQTNAAGFGLASGFGLDTFCQATRYLDIVCSQLTANQSLKDTMSQTVARDVLARVYLGDSQGVQSTVLPSSATFCPPGCMPTTIYKNYSQPKQIQWIPNQPVPGFLQFDVYDDNGQPLQETMPSYALGNGANWSMTMLVSEN
jgi:hypothetical protein